MKRRTLPAEQIDRIKQDSADYWESGGAKGKLADFSGADLTSVDFSEANLRGVDFSNANLSHANLSHANLRNANLTNALLTSTNLCDANLSDANLCDASLSEIKKDMFSRLSFAKDEAAGLLLAIEKGRIDGTAYKGNCACFVGTIAKLKKVNYKNISGLAPDDASPTERWFLAIREGDTPQDNQVAKITADWISEFLAIKEK